MLFRIVMFRCYAVNDTLTTLFAAVWAKNILAPIVLKVTAAPANATAFKTFHLSISII
jgi:hypothetical protein